MQDGHCTSFLASQINEFEQQKSAKFDCTIHKSAKILRLPSEWVPNMQFIIIAQGSGVTPFISILERI